MHPHVIQACEALYMSIARTQGFNPWLCDRAEEALTELINNPDRSDPPSHLVRNALSNATKKLGRRSELEEAYLPTLEFGIDRTVDQNVNEVVFDVESVLSRMPVPERTLLELAIDGSEADEISIQMNLPTQRVREKLSRARARARALRIGGAS